VWHNVFCCHQLLADTQRIFVKQKFNCRGRHFITISVKLQTRLRRTLPIATLRVTGETSLRGDLLSPIDHVFDTTAQWVKFCFRHDPSQNVITFFSELLPVDLHDVLLFLTQVLSR
jgi:hypothetical protein